MNKNIEIADLWLRCQICASNEIGLNQNKIARKPQLTSEKYSVKCETAKSLVWSLISDTDPINLGKSCSITVPLWGYVRSKS